MSVLPGNFRASSHGKSATLYRYAHSVFRLDFGMVISRNFYPENRNCKAVKP